VEEYSKAAPEIDPKDGTHKKVALFRQQRLAIPTKP